MSNEASAASGLVQVTFLLLGIAQLTTWNTFVKSIPYFNQTLPAISISLLNLVNFNAPVGGAMSTAYSLGNCVATFALVLGRWEERWIGICGLITIGLGGNVMMLFWIAITGILLPILPSFTHFTLIPVQSVPPILIAISTISGICNAIAVKGLFSLMAISPGPVVSIFFAGNALSGLLVSTTSLVAALATPTVSEKEILGQSAPAKARVELINKGYLSLQPKDAKAYDLSGSDHSAKNSNERPMLASNGLLNDQDQWRTTFKDSMSIDYVEMTKSSVFVLGPLPAGGYFAAGISVLLLALLLFYTTISRSPKFSRLLKKERVNVRSQSNRMQPNLDNKVVNDRMPLASRNMAADGEGEGMQTANDDTKYIDNTFQSNRCAIDSQAVSPLPFRDGHLEIAIECRSDLEVEQSVWDVMMRIHWSMAGMIVTFAGTISLFASVLVSPRIPISSNYDTLTRIYQPIVFFLYDLGDLVGRWMVPTPDSSQGQSKAMEKEMANGARDNNICSPSEKDRVMGALMVDQNGTDKASYHIYPVNESFDTEIVLNPLDRMDKNPWKRNSDSLNSIYNLNSNVEQKEILDLRQLKQDQSKFTDLESDRLDCDGENLMTVYNYCSLEQECIIDSTQAAAFKMDAKERVPCNVNSDFNSLQIVRDTVGRDVDFENNSMLNNDEGNLPTPLVEDNGQGKKRLLHGAIRWSPLMRLILFPPLLYFTAPTQLTLKYSRWFINLVPFPSADLLYALTLFLFGVSNGWCSTSIFVYASKMADSGGRAVEKEIYESESVCLTRKDCQSGRDRLDAGLCGSLLGLSLTVGLLLGSVTSHLWKMLS